MKFNSNLILKLISIPSLFFLCFIFGIIPYVIKKCRMNETFLSYANTFSVCLFLGIGQFDLLNERVEKLYNYTKMPLAYYLSASGFCLILFIQKVVFGYILSKAEENLENDTINNLKNDNLSPSINKDEDLNNENEEGINQNDINKVSKNLNNFF